MEQCMYWPQARMQHRWYRRQTEGHIQAGLFANILAAGLWTRGRSKRHGHNLDGASWLDCIRDASPFPPMWLDLRAPLDYNASVSFRHFHQWGAIWGASLDWLTSVTVLHCPPVDAHGARFGSAP